MMTLEVVGVYALVAGAAFVAAAVNSIAGGGTFLTFPMLTGPARLTDKIANMTSTVGLVPGSAAGVLAAMADFRRLPFGLVISYGAISTVGGVAGSLLLRHTRDVTFSLVVPWLLLFATVLFGFSKMIAKWAGAKHGQRSPGWTLAFALVQFFIAIYGGYFGAGIGVLMLAGLSFTGLENIHQMNAMKVLLATIINSVASVVFVVGSLGASPENAIHWPIAGVMVVASIAGGFLGMGLARRIPAALLRAIVLVVGSSLSAIYFYRAYAA